MYRKSISTIPYGIVVPFFAGLCVYTSLHISDNIHSFLIFRTDHNALKLTEFRPFTPVTKQPPTSVFIPKLNKRLPIQAGVVVGNNWTLFDTSVAWLSTSSVPNEGNVILYAHNWKSLWGDLNTLQPGDLVEVDQNQKVYRYTVTESRAVDQNDLNAILSTENMITMYTCEGSFDQKRRVVYAKPV